MKNKNRLLALLSLSLIFLPSCGNKLKQNSKSYAAAEFQLDEASGSIATESKSAGFSSASAKQKASPDRIQPKESGAQEYECKLIRTGEVSIQVQSLSDTRAATESWVKSFGGYISNSSETSRSLSITVRIPSVNFDDAMSQASGMGKLVNKQINSNDVTEQFYDLQGRIATKQILLERYQNYLREATKINDILDVEARINEVTSDLESMRGRMNRLSSQIDFSTIHISASLPPKQTEQGFVLPDTKSQFITLIGNIAGFFNALLFIVLYIAIFSVPIVLLAAVFWWLTFGKIGLVRRLFSRISKKD